MVLKGKLKIDVVFVKVLVYLEGFLGGVDIFVSCFFIIFELKELDVGGNVFVNFIFNVGFEGWWGLGC